MEAKTNRRKKINKWLLLTIINLFLENEAHKWTLSHFSKKDFMISWVNDHQFGAHDGAAIEIPAPKERKINYYPDFIIIQKSFL